MKRPATLFILIYVLCSFSGQPNFLSQQKKYERVKTAYKEKFSLVEERLSKSNIKLEDLNILICAYKAEQQLDVYGKNKSESKYKKICSYDICASSGQPGPKRVIGDGQVPEGFYYVDRFNPVSNFYLSLGLNYPNESDRKKGKTGNLGGDIFIHGNCVTIGCLPMTDEQIKEIYIYAIQARQSGQLKIPVYIFPFKESNENMEKYSGQYKDNAQLISFWKNLKIGYDKFETNLQELKVAVDDKGNYLFQ